jgi:hypothetical protein
VLGGTAAGGAGEKYTSSAQQLGQRQPFIAVLYCRGDARAGWHLLRVSLRPFLAFWINPLVAPRSFFVCARKLAQNTHLNPCPFSPQIQLNLRGTLVVDGGGASHGGWPKLWWPEL